MASTDLQFGNRKMSQIWKKNSSFRWHKFSKFKRAKVRPGHFASIKFQFNRQNKKCGILDENKIRLIACCKELSPWNWHSGSIFKETMGPNMQLNASYFHPRYSIFLHFIKINFSGWGFRGKIELEDSSGWITNVGIRKLVILF